MVRAASAAFLTVGSLVALPATAGAVTASGTDPTGDVTSGTSYDITGVSATLTTSTVTVAVTTAGALPVKTDPTWSSTTSTGRSLYVDFGAALGHQGFIMDGGDATAIGYGRDADTECAGATTNISGSTITLSATAACFGNPGKLQVSALIQKGTQPANGDLDFAIAPTVTDNFTDGDITTVDAALAGGYYQLGADGGVFSFGDAPFYGSTGSLDLNAPVVGMSEQPTGDGYRFVASDGGVFNYGSATFFGSMGGKPLNKPIVGMAASHTGNGYWLVASDGGIFAYGDAAFYGSMGGQPLNKPIVGMAATPSGNGYWLVASDGGIFSYGDAAFYGSTGSTTLNAPIVGMAPSHSGNGYWLLGEDGGIFSYGDATFHGSDAPDATSPAVAINANAAGDGYYITYADGIITNFGAALDFGDILRYLDGDEANADVVGMAVNTAAS